MARKCEQPWHSCQQDNTTHVQRISAVNNVSSPSSIGIEPVSWLPTVQIDGKQMWAIVTFMPKRQINPRTERQLSQGREFSEFARNGTSELIIIWWNRMARKCELAWHSCQQDNTIYVQRIRVVNNASSPSSIGIEPVSWFSSVQIEWQGNVSKHVILEQKTNQSTYIATVYPTSWVLRVRSEWNP
jgi:hypothetical protein